MMAGVPLPSCEISASRMVPFTLREMSTEISPEVYLPCDSKPSQADKMNRETQVYWEHSK